MSRLAVKVSASGGARMHEGIFSLMQRGALGSHAEEAERARVDGEPVRRRDRLDRERGAEGARLRLRNLGETNEQRPEQRM